MHDLARLGAAERRNIVSDFVEDVFDGLDAEPGIVARMRLGDARAARRSDRPSRSRRGSSSPSSSPTPDFRGRVRAMAQRSADDRAAGGSVGVRAATESPASGTERERRGAAAQLVAEQAGAALAAGIDPAFGRGAPRSSKSSCGLRRSC